MDVRVRSRRRDERGAAALEFAMVLPVLMILVFGIISFGYMLSFRQAVSQAAAEGARVAAVAPAAIDDAERTTRAVDAINDALGSYGVTCSSGVLSRDGAPAGTCAIEIKDSCTNGIGACAEVRLDYTYRDDPLLPRLLTGPLLPEHLVYQTEVRVS